MPKPSDMIDEARERVSPVIQRIEAFRYDPPAIGAKVALLVMLACAVGTGFAYYTGKRIERHWWRTQIAAQSAAANTIMRQLDAEAPDHDERLIKEWTRDHADQLRAAERRLQAAQIDASRNLQKMQSGVPYDSCTLPAHCLRAGPSSGAASSPAAGSP